MISLDFGDTCGCGGVNHVLLIDKTGTIVGDFFKVHGLDEDGNAIEQALSTLIENNGVYPGTVSYGGWLIPTDESGWERFS